MLMLQLVLLLHEGTHALQSTRERIASQRQHCLKRERTGKSGLRPSRGEAWPIQSARKVFGQQEAAVEAHIDHIWLYHNMPLKYD